MGNGDVKGLIKHEWFSEKMIVLRHYDIRAYTTLICRLDLERSRKDEKGFSI